MKNLKTVLRIIFSVFLLFFGLNGFLQFAPMPEVGPVAGAFLGAIASTGLFFPIISLIEVASGVALLVNKATPLALVVVFPVLFCATLFHISLDPGGVLFALIGLILNIILFVSHKDKYLALARN